MKKRMLMIVFVLFFVFSLCSCVEGHQHKFEEKVVEATCLNVGYTLFQCECGYEYKGNETPIGDHSYGEWTVVKEATESEEGLKEKTCIYCDNKVEESIDALVHTHEFTEWEILIESDNLNPGLQQRKCLVCGLEEESTMVSLDDMEVVLDKYYFEIGLNEKFNEEFNAVLTNGKITYQLTEENYILPSKSYTKTGLYSSNICFVFYGFEFNVTIKVKVKNYLPEEDILELNFYNTLNYIFEYDKYLFYCDNSNMYQYDILRQELVKTFNLHGVANGHYIDDEYLYVVAHDINNKKNYKQEDCFGTVTKIDLNSFDINKQVTVNTNPYGIIVDKRGNVIIGEGRHSGFYTFNYVDMDNGELTELYRKHYDGIIFYHNENDVIFEFTLGVSPSSIRVYHFNQDYISGYQDVYELCVSKFLKFKNNILLQADRVGYYEYTDKPMHHTNMCFQLYKIQDSINWTYKYESADLDNSYVYFVCRTEEKEGFYDKMILKTALYSNDYEKYDVKVKEDCEIVYTYSYENKLYLVTSTNKIIILNNE